MLHFNLVAVAQRAPWKRQPEPETQSVLLFVSHAKWYNAVSSSEIIHPKIVFVTGDAMAFFLGAQRLVRMHFVKLHSLSYFFEQFLFVSFVPR